MLPLHPPFLLLTIDARQAPLLLFSLVPATPHIVPRRWLAPRQEPPLYPFVSHATGENRQP
jgi:hypothetical protein